MTRTCPDCGSELLCRDEGSGRISFDNATVLCRSDFLRRMNTMGYGQAVAEAKAANVPFPMSFFNLPDGTRLMWSM
jgi:hypothetical protein